MAAVVAAVTSLQLYLSVAPVRYTKYKWHEYLKSPSGGLNVPP